MNGVGERIVAEMQYCGGRLEVVRPHRPSSAYGDVDDAGGSRYVIRFQGDQSVEIDTVDDLRAVPRGDRRVESAREDPGTFALAYSSLMSLGRVILVPDLYRHLFDNESDVDKRLPVVKGDHLCFTTVVAPPVYSLGGDEVGSWVRRDVRVDVQELGEPEIESVEVPAS